MRITLQVFLFIFMYVIYIGSAQNMNNIIPLSNYRLSYIMYYQRDSTDKETNMSESMELFTNGEKSVFRSTAHAYVDSIRNGLQPLKVVPIVGVTSSYSIEKNFIEEKLSYYGSIRLGNKDFYMYRENMDNMTWSLHNDTSTVNGIMCQKASIDYGGRHWVAWFTNDIPIRDGPYKFCNLPGLIVNIHSSDGYWRFELTDIHPVEQLPEIINSGLAEEIPKDSYYKLKRDYLYNAVEIEEASGNGIFRFESDENRRRVIQGRKISAQKDNNWIELYP